MISGKETTFELQNCIICQVNLQSAAVKKYNYNQ